MSSADSAPLDESSAATRGSIVLAGAQVVVRALQIAFVLVVTRTVAEADFGRYSITAALLVFGGFVAEAGSTPAIVRFVSRDSKDAPALLGGTLLASGALGVAGWAVVSVAAAMIYGGPVTVDALIAGAGLPAATMSTSVFGALDGLGEIQRRAKVSVVQPIVSIGVGATLVVVTGSIRAGMVALALGGWAALLAALFAARRVGFWPLDLRPNRAVIWRVLRVAGPFALLSGLGTVSGRFDLLFLGAREGSSASAAYDIALRSSEAVWTMHTLVTGPGLFLLSRRLGGGDKAGAQRAYDLAVRWSYTVGALFGVVVIVGRHEIVRLLGAGSYAHADSALAILGASTALSLVALVQGTLVLAGDHLRAGLATAGLVTLATVVLDVWLIVPFGVVGAAVAGAATAVVSVAAFSVCHRTTVGLRTALPPWGVVVGSVASTSLFGLLAPAGAVAISGAAAVYLGAVALSGPSARRDLSSLAAAVRRRQIA